MNIDIVDHLYYDMHYHNNHDYNNNSSNHKIYHSYNNSSHLTDLVYHKCLHLDDYIILIDQIDINSHLMLNITYTKHQTDKL